MAILFTETGLAEGVMDLPIILQNEFFVVVDKPAGVLSVPGRKGGGTEGPDLARILSEQTGGRIWPVHRLDQAVSGILLYARQAESHRVANAWFEKHLIGKYYEALTEGPAPREGQSEQVRRRRGEPHRAEVRGSRPFQEQDPAEIETHGSRPVQGQERSETARWETKILRGKKRAYESSAGKPAITEAQWLGTVVWRHPVHRPQEPEHPSAVGPRQPPPQPPEARTGPAAGGAEDPAALLLRRPKGSREASASGAQGRLLKLQHWSLRPLTGRPHQLRFELSRRGWPVWGDALYGSTRPFPIPDSIALRAVSLDLTACPEAPAFGLPPSFEVAPLLPTLRWLLAIGP